MDGYWYRSGGYFSFEDIAIGSRCGVRIPGWSNPTKCRQRLATAATFLWSCVAQALSRGDGPRHSLHAPALYRGYKEDFIVFIFFYIGIDLPQCFRQFLRKKKRYHGLRAICNLRHCFWVCYFSLVIPRIYETSLDLQTQKRL